MKSSRRYPFGKKSAVGAARDTRVGIKDVSREAGVAISTVSHVLNGTAPISSDVRGRVLDAARRLGYLAKRQAKASISALDTILLAVPSDTVIESQVNLFSFTLLSALTRECERRGIRIVPLTAEGKAFTPAQLVEGVQEAQAEGIILLSEDRSELLSGIATSGIPAVLINGEDHGMQIDSVTPGNRFAARLATDWLIRQGHRSILHLTWEGRSTITRRRDGFLDAFRVNGLPLEDAHIQIAEGYLPQYGAAAMARWLDEHDGLDGITAVFCAADNLALGAMTALQKAGLRVPADVSVMGFDGVTIGELTDPPLTTVSVPLEQLGPAALHLLEQRILNPHLERAAHRLELGCRLSIRDSVAQPR
jgi:LacI family purine nucleotide synthesis repressor